MIKEDYVSFEVAKLLKEKGFDGWCDHFYDFYPETNEVHICGCDEHNNSRYEDEYSMPTLQIAMKWLREVHNIHIIVHPYTDMEGQHWGFTFDKFTYGCWMELSIYITDSWNTYEEAVEAAIKYSLENLI